ncbi:MAG: AAA family ATPase [Candidatus Heimdallarchaeota archaeon]|nr:AAA family ATPase [Candidatus Heimdallarchaeota archaeon]
MGQLDKRTFSQFAEFDCERQLFVNLGRDDSRWLDPQRKIIPLTDIRRRGDFAKILGRNYESEVYRYLKRKKFAIYSQAPSGEVAKTTIVPSKLHEIYDEIEVTKPKILLEHEFPTPKSFLLNILDLDTTNDSIPIEEYSQRLRPDLMILKKIDPNSDEKFRTININNDLIELDAENIQDKIGISIIDIKATPQDAVGKRQFIELIFYALALNQYLHINSLQTKYFVDLDSNGILTKTEDPFIDDLDDIIALTELMKWEETYRLYDQIIKHIQQLRKNAPTAIETTPVNIQPACGRCNYLEDCKTTLGVYEGNGPKNWDIRLLPYTSRSMVEQLSQFGFNSIGEVADGIESIEVGSTPQAIYPQLPLLKIKSQAIVNNAETKPKEGSIHSVAIPVWNEMSLVVNVEEDPIYKRIFAISYYLSVSVPKTAKYKDNYNTLISIWDQLIKKKIPIARAKQDLKQLNITIPDVIISSALTAIQSLSKLNAEVPSSMKIIVKGEKLSENSIADNAIINLGYSNVNMGLDDNDEFNFAKRSVSILHDILVITDFIEQFVVVHEIVDEKERYYSPRLAIYYWSKEILEAIQTMLERHLNRFTNDDESRTAFYYIIRWFTPTDSGIKDPLQHKKVYDLRIFVETTIGLPALINYTWHGIAKTRYDYSIKKKYWRKHFNYIDFQVWHELLSVTDFSEKNNFVTDLKSQMLHKVQTINRIRLDFQISSRELISRYAKPTDYFVSRRNRLPNTYNYLAHMWFLFSKLTSAIAEHEALYIRTIYPEFSIGKLAAGEVSDIREIQGSTPKRRYYTFQLRRLSSNMKLKEADQVLLVPSELRDSSIDQRAWNITIDQMIWNAGNDCYDITTVESTVRVLEKLKEITEKDNSIQWYLFPKSVDAWSTKLFRVLNMHNLGQSWLGKKIAFDWRLLPLPELEYPEGSIFDLPEIYLYSPSLLYKFDKPIIEELLTQASPKPDPSQHVAITASLSKIVSMIHGPPGTGKSQTIVALIDEFLLRTEHLNRPRRILVTAFSYPAMRVLVAKLQESVRENSEPTFARKTTKVFIRSESQKIVDNAGLETTHFDYVHDLMRKGSGTWKLNITEDPTSRKPVFTDKQKLEDYFPENLIVFSNAHQLYRLKEKGRNTEYKCTQDDFAFDLIIVDEASQLPVDQILPSLTFLRHHRIQAKFPSIVEKDEPISSVDESRLFHIPDHIHVDPDNMTKLVLVGDNFQLPPVQPIKPPLNLELVLGSIFQYYRKGHELPSKQLKTNYRSHEHIVDYTGRLGFYESLTAFEANSKRLIQGTVPDETFDYVKQVLDPNRVVSAIIHEKKYDVSVSPIESMMVVEIIVAFFKMINPMTEIDQINFWKEEIGVVAPHNAQGRLIIRKLFERLTEENLNLLEERGFMSAIKSTVYSVEKFQGSDRTMIIASVGISSTDQIGAEEDFIYDINRFNVLTSRAKSKVILITSRNFIDYFPNDRTNVENAAQIRNYTLKHCNKSQIFKLEDQNGDEEIEVRWHDSD